MSKSSWLLSRFRRLFSRFNPQRALLTLAAAAAVTTLVTLVVQYYPLPPQSEVLPLSEQAYVPGEFLVKFNPGTSQESILEFNRKLGVEVLEYLKDLGVYRLKVPQGFSVPQMVKLYQNNPDVEYAEPNYILEASPTPTASQP